MINNTGINQPPDSRSEGNIPLNEAYEETLSVLSVNKLKKYGKKSLSPLIELAHKYQDDITPYFDAISKGLQGGVDSLSRPTDERGGDVQVNTKIIEAEKVVAGWFKEAVDGLNGARTKLSGSGPQEIMDYIETQASKHPGVMFSSSYLVGLFIGRIGRHIGYRKDQDPGSTNLTQ